MSQTMDEDVPDMTPAAHREEKAPASLGRPVGFIGLGAMGLPMATSLVRAGHAVLACDTDFARLSLMAECCGGGVHTTSIAAELGSRCELVFLMLPGSRTVAEVTGDLATTMPPGGRIVDLGHSDPAETRVLAAALGEKSLRLVDAPALGGPDEAAAATLAFKIGGTQGDVVAVEPYLKAMGGASSHTGGIGSAHQAVWTPPA